MRKPPRISEAEWEVMKVFWKKSPRTANDTVKTLSSKTRWKRETIRTLINRLVQKKALGYQKKGRCYEYFALVKEAECVREETKTFLKRFHGGSIEPMLTHFVQQESLSPERIARLREILDQAAEQQKRRGEKSP
jgi:BlaI family penicillinase repressor